MPPLDPPDSHHLNAASGWLSLGNAIEAWTEFNQIQATLRSHPEVLQFEWQLLARDQRWLEALHIGERLVEAAPDEPSAWVQRLLPAAARFPQDLIIPYNLACYTCQLGDLVTARCWLDQSLALSENLRQKLERLQAALEDADLQPLWPELTKRKAELQKEVDG
jgi:hypothetical protein